MAAPRDSSGKKPSRVPLLIAFVVPAIISLVSALGAAGVFVAHNKDGTPATPESLVWNALAFGLVAVIVALVGVRSAQKNRSG